MVAEVIGMGMISQGQQGGCTKNKVVDVTPSPEE